MGCHFFAQPIGSSRSLALHAPHSQWGFRFRRLRTTWPWLQLHLQYLGLAFNSEPGFVGGDAWELLL